MVQIHALLPSSIWVSRCPRGANVIVWTTRCRALLDVGPASLVQVGGGSFLIPGLTPTRGQVAVGAGLTAQRDANLALFADYAAILHTGNTTSQTVEARLRHAF